MAEQAIQIGELSRRTGCNIETIRYYERIGLMPAPPRRGRYRSYGGEDVGRLGFVRRARELGFTLDEVRALLGLAGGGHGSTPSGPPIGRGRATPPRVPCASSKRGRATPASSLKAAPPRARSSNARPTASWNSRPESFSRPPGGKARPRGRAATFPAAPVPGARSTRSGEPWIGPPSPSSRAAALADQGEHAAKEAAAEAEAEVERLRLALYLFREFVIVNAKVWERGSNHHHPVWGMVADLLDGHPTHPRPNVWRFILAHNREPYEAEA